MAQYLKRGKGWQARISWYDSFGKRHTKSKAGFKTKKLAQIWAVDNEDKLNKGVAVDKEISLYDYFARWVETYKEPKVAQYTLNRYHINQKVIQQYFGDTNIKDITRSTYQKFLNDYGKTHAPDTVRKLNSCIRSCVQSAILDDYLIKDFTQGVVANGNDSKSLKVEYLNLKEIKALLHECQLNLDWRYTSRFMIIAAIYTGMRKEELQALTWSDIDFVNHTISINKAWREIKRSDESEKHFQNHRFKPAKAKNSTRKIKVNTELLDCLKILRDHAHSNMVFMNEFGTLPTSTALNRKLRGLLANLTIKRRNFHFHSLRHSHVALLLANGIDIYAISKRLGHGDVSVTSNIYAYLIDEYKDKTDDQIVKALSNL
ncbi:site-specific integrase [Limosilactobacillus caecicola]|uniref:site-specific integrase n=1 Tax=Limosilactobacillus caecicola TaxID=2941332 RepID=UPI002041EBCC|nr:tyrosine-type recombinase/integrase [Limosilactobacillus caecicola]